MLGRVADDRDDDDGDEELREIGAVCKRLQRPDERFREEGGHDRRQSEHQDRGRQGPTFALELGRHEELSLPPKRVTRHRYADDQQEDRERKREQCERMTVWISVKPRDRDDEEDKCREADHPEGRVGRRAIDATSLAEEQREAENEQEISGDRPHERCPHDVGQAVGDGDDGDDQLRRVAERRVQEAADARPRVKREVVRRFTDQPGEREQRQGGKQEELDLAGGIYAIENDDQRPQQQRQCQ